MDVKYQVKVEIVEEICLNLSRKKPRTRSGRTQTMPYSMLSLTCKCACFTPCCHGAWWTTRSIVESCDARSFHMVFIMVYGTNITIFAWSDDHTHSRDIQWLRMFPTLIGLDPMWLEVRLMVIKWLVGQTIVVKGIEVLFQCGLNRWTPVGVLFDKETSQRL